jgi:SAM-dependent methyltransferase
MNKPMFLDKMICPLCYSERNEPYFYPPTEFNGKVFHYKTCSACHCSYVHPFPDQSDFDSIYGENDHSYLKNLAQDEKHVYKFELPLYNHQRYQLDFFRNGEYWKNADSLLDIGCGSGFYMSYARMFGLKVVGIEYNEEFTGLLRKKTDLDIFSFSEFEKKFEGKKFDLIHFGHILEHLIRPDEMLALAKRYAHDKTILIIDGPLEKNKSLARFVISIGSRIKRNKLNYYAPQHITFTDTVSQQMFFERNNLEKLRFKVAEQMWPLPAEPDFKSPKNFILFLIGRLSVVFSKLNPGWGNVFHYAGKFKK